MAPELPQQQLTLKDRIRTLQQQAAALPEFLSSRLGFLNRLAELAENDFEGLNQNSVSLIESLISGYEQAFQALSYFVTNMPNLGMSMEELSGLNSFQYAEKYIQTIPAEEQAQASATLDNVQKMIIGFLQYAQVEQPKVNMDIISKSVIKHDIGKHIYLKLEAFARAIWILAKYPGKVPTSLENEGADSRWIITFEQALDSFINYMNYFSVMVALEAGISVNNEDFVSSLPGDVQVTFTEGNFENNISPEAYTAIRTIVLNAIQYLRTTDEVAPEVKIEVKDGQTKEALLKLIQQTDPNVQYSAGRIADEVSDTQAFITFNIANQASAQATEKLIADFEAYLAEPGLATVADKGMRLGLNMVIADLGMVGTRKVAALSLTIMSGGEAHEVRIMVACPETDQGSSPSA